MAGDHGRTRLGRADIEQRDDQRCEVAREAAERREAELPVSPDRVRTPGAAEAALTASGRRSTGGRVQGLLSLSAELPVQTTSAEAHQVLVDLPGVTVFAAAAALERKPDKVADAVAALDEDVEVLGQLEGRVEVLKLDNRRWLGRLKTGRRAGVDRRGRQKSVASARDLGEDWLAAYRRG